MFGLRDVLGHCPQPLEKSTHWIFSHKLTKNHLETHLYSLNPNSHSGRWFHHLLALIRNAFWFWCLLPAQGSWAPWPGWSAHVMGGDRRDLLLTSRGLSFIQVTGSSYLWLLLAEIPLLSRLAQDAKWRGTHYCFPWIPTKLLPVWELEINLSVGL